MGVSAATMISSNVYAQNGATTNGPATTNVTDKSKITDRVSERKNLLKLQFNQEQTQKISSNCVAAQARIKNIASTEKKAADKRQETYTNLSTRATTVLRSLQKQGLDISESKAAQIQFDAAINQYIADTSKYRDVVADSLEINCATDPVGFEATLTTARALRITMANDANQVKVARTILSQVLAKITESLKEKAEVRQ
jgi:hypothetical protein